MNKIKSRNSKEYKANRCLYSQNRRRKLISEGLCIDCGKPRLANGTTTRCRRCADKANSRTARHKNERSQRKVCKECGGERWGKSVLCKKHCIAAIINRYGFKISDYEAFLALLEKQNYRCHYSGLELIGGDTLSLDHVIPKSRGGTNDISNLVWCHKAVNTFKGTMTAEEFIDFCKKIVDFNLNKNKIT